VQVNGASDDNAVLVEITAHVGRVRGAQGHKLAADAFKLIWVSSRLGSTRRILAVVDDEVAAYLRHPKAWLTTAREDNQVEVIQVQLQESVRDSIVAAQKMQYR
jgi:hypothetical protein